jgi:hypothetical protein
MTADELAKKLNLAKDDDGNILVPEGVMRGILTQAAINIYSAYRDGKIPQDVYDEFIEEFTEAVKLFNDLKDAEFALKLRSAFQVLADAGIKPPQKDLLN